MKSLDDEYENLDHSDIMFALVLIGLAMAVVSSIITSLIWWWAT